MIEDLLIVDVVFMFDWFIGIIVFKFFIDILIGDFI